MQVSVAACELMAWQPCAQVKKKEKPEVLIERSVRNKRKCITTVKGLELFGVKLADAAKVFGKKFACGASVVKGAVCEAIDIQASSVGFTPVARTHAADRSFDSRGRMYHRVTSRRSSRSSLYPVTKRCSPKTSSTWRRHPRRPWPLASAHKHTSSHLCVPPLCTLYQSSCPTILHAVNGAAARDVAADAARLRCLHQQCRGSAGSAVTPGR
jgi:translation initiation factor 1 (eIF-1/SUI1)